jgi:hypothetical protein
MLQRRSWDHSAFEHLDQQEGKNDRYGDAEQNHSDRVQNCGTERRMSSRLLKYPTFGLRELQTFKFHIVRRSWTLSSHSETFFRNLPGLLAKRCTVSDLVLSINAAFTTQLFFLASFVGIAARWLSISNCTDDSSAMELLRSLVLFARSVGMKVFRTPKSQSAFLVAQTANAGAHPLRRSLCLRIQRPGRRGRRHIT